MFLEGTHPEFTSIPIRHPHVDDTNHKDQDRVQGERIPAEPIQDRKPRRQHAARSAIPVKTVRAAMRRAVAVAGLRAVALEVGLSAPGLALFLDGSHPRRDTLARLAGWYLAHGWETVRIGTDVAAAALAVLVDRLPPRGQRRATVATLKAVRREHELAGIDSPDWLVDLEKNPPSVQSATGL